MGNDHLYGGKGNDTPTGGSDSDVFYLSGGNDIIRDFQMGGTTSELMRHSPTIPIQF